jgi:drug/metabolite transporter (DMT)-like permease
MTEAPHAARTARIAAFIGCCAIWGTTFLVIRIGNDAVPPVWAACLRLTLASALLWLWTAFRHQAAPRGRALTAAVQYGVFQFGLNMPLLYWGETAVPSGLSAVFYATGPITLALLARAAGLEQLTRRKIMGAVIATGGVALIFSSELAARVPPLPLAAVFTSALVAPIGSTLLKRGPAQSAIGVNAVGCSVGAAMCFVWSIVLSESHAVPRTAGAILPIVYLTLAGSLGAFLLWTWLVHHAPLSKISYIAVLTPLVALAVGALVRGERIAALTLAGAAVVFAGVVIGLRAPTGRATGVSR